MARRVAAPLQILSKRMSMWALLLIIVVAGSLFLARRARGNKRGTTRAVRSPYQCVTVKWDLEACQAVQELDGQRFISTEAPSFPLPGCSAEKCTCRYEFHGDRRDGERRLLHGIRHSLIVVSGGNDQRVQSERRSDA